MNWKALDDELKQLSLWSDIPAIVWRQVRRELRSWYPVGDYQRWIENAALRSIETQAAMLARAGGRLQLTPFEHRVLESERRQRRRAAVLINDTGTITPEQETQLNQYVAAMVVKDLRPLRVEVSFILYTLDDISAVMIWREMSGCRLPLVAYEHDEKRAA